MLKKPFVKKKTSIKSTDSFNYGVVIFFALFTVGVIFGCATIKRGDDALVKSVGSVLAAFLNKDVSAGFVKCLISSFIAAVILPCVTLFAGLCAFGMPLVVFMPLFSGTVFGLVSASYFSQYQMKGLGFCTLVLFPFFAIIAGTLFKCCSESLVMSFDLFSFITGSDNRNSRKPDLKTYFSKYAVFLIPLAAASVFRTIGFQLFSGLFDFIN